MLHAVRLKGTTDEFAVASRYALDHRVVHDLLVDFEAAGWVRPVGHRGVDAHRGVQRWSLTEAGRTEIARQLAQELAQVGAREVVTAAYQQFLPLNARFLAACTDWQIRPLRWDAMAVNDHTNYRWDLRVLDEVGSLGKALHRVCAQLSSAMSRLDGYSRRFTAALDHAQRGEWDYMDGAQVDSCHTVWMQLHEDLLATLGISRADEPSQLT